MKPVIAEHHGDPVAQMHGIVAQNSYRTSGSFDLFPQHCLLPKFTPKQATNHVAQNVYTIPYKQNHLKFMHQTFFYPHIETLEERGMKPTLNVTDNQAVKPIGE